MHIWLSGRLYRIFLDVLAMNVISHAKKSQQEDTSSHLALSTRHSHRNRYNNPIQKIQHERARHPFVYCTVHTCTRYRYRHVRAHEIPSLWGHRQIQMTMVLLFRLHNSGLFSLLLATLCIFHTAAYPLIAEVPENENKVSNNVKIDLFTNCL